MKGKNKTLFIAGIAVACVAYAVKNSTKEDKLWQNVSSVAIPLGLVVSTIAYLSNVD